MTAVQSFKPVTTAAVGRALSKAGFTAAKWNRNTETVYNTGYILGNETWGQNYVSVSFDYAGRYRKLTEMEIAETAQQLDLMAEALERAGYTVAMLPGYLKVRMEDTQRFSITLDGLTKEQLAKVQALIAA